MRNITDLSLVIGATGLQGGASARHLLALGRPVRFLTRNVQSRASRALTQAGAQAQPGDLDDAISLAAAMAGTKSVFSVQLPDLKGDDSERRQGDALVRAALAAGVTQVIHTSVAQTGHHQSFPGWESGRWWNKYWTDKFYVEQAVRNAGFDFWTILQPAFMMDNFVEPRAHIMFPALAKGQLVTALLPETRLDFIAANDVGVFAAAAVAEPKRFHSLTIPLAAQSITMIEVATILSSSWKSAIKAVYVSSAVALARGLLPGWVNSQEWMNEVGYQVNIDQLKSFGLPLMTLQSWATDHRGTS